MKSSSQPVLASGQIATLLFQYPLRWMLPTLIVGALATAYALVRPDVWEASQALIVRNEAAAGQASPGKFSQSDEMKTVQETILELARSRAVLSEALRRVGPPAEYAHPHDHWPSAEDVADLDDSLKIAAPKGVEFGRTEVFYLKVRDHDRPRAIALAQAVTVELEHRYQALRDARASSMTDEMLKAARLAQDDLATSADRLAAVEKRVGSDLAELRVLTEPASGESALQRTMTEIRSELRAARTRHNSHGELLAQLRLARQDPMHLAGMPGELLESQPSLKRLKEGLVDAQLRTAEMEGRMSANHPLVIGARQSADEIRLHLAKELDVAIRGLDAELRLDADRVKLMEGQLGEVTSRLDRLAAQRTEYANLVAEVRNRTTLRERAEERLAEVRAAQATATAASLLSRIDQPDTGPKPLGPSRIMLVLLGMGGGLMAGLGLLLLTAAPIALPSAEGDEVDAPSRDLLTAPNGTTVRRSLSVAQSLARLSPLHS